MSSAPRLLVSGLSGFVGGWVQRLAKGSHVLLPLADEQGQAVDLLDTAAVAAAVRRLRPDLVLHLAAQSHVPSSFQDPATTLQVNLLGTLHLLQALDAADFRGALLMVSSGDTYGLVDEGLLPISEDLVQRPRSPYAVSKVAAEALCWQWSQTQANYRVLTARSFNHIGPGQDPRFAVADFARQVARIAKGLQEPCLSVGDIDATRDFSDVRDVVQAYLRLLERGESGGCYNVCSGREHSLREIIHELCRLAAISPRIEQDPARLRPSEQRRVCGDPSRLIAATDWAPSFSLSQSLHDILAHWQAQEHP